MLFSALARIYGTIANARNLLYKKGFLTSHSLGAKTVSVGNITVGGTGKTPLVALIAEILAANGEKVCILSRGYGRVNPKNRVLVADGGNVLTNARTAGDEPYELAVNLRGKAVIISDANRVAAARWARQKFAVTAFVLDDAFQHQKAKRDLNIVLIDATNPFGNSKTLPSGFLREPLENLERADLIVISRVNLVSENELADLKSKIKNFTDCQIFTARNQISKLTELTNQNQNSTNESLKSEILNLESEILNLKSEISFAFCALGNPQNFFDQLKSENFNLRGTKVFPDHHFYTAKNVENLHKNAIATGAEIFLTTAKDAVKLTEYKFSLPCYVVENKMIFDNKQAFVGIIESVAV